MKKEIYQQFKGMSAEIREFLIQLGENNTKEWFDAHRDFYDESVKGQLKALVVEMGARFMSMGLPYIADPKKAIFRINKDIRFSADKSPYKTNLGVFFPYTISQAFVKATESLGLYFHFEPESTFIAGGMHMPQPVPLRAIRERIADDYEKLNEILSKPRLKAEFPEILLGERLKRAPQGFPHDHPAVELLKLKEFTLFAPLSFEETYSPALADILAKKGAEIEPFLIYLYEALE